MLMSRWRKKHKKKDIEIENKREGKTEKKKTFFFFKESDELSKHE
jgi:hypothetical protein